MKICKTCGKPIWDDENDDLAYTVNSGIPGKEYVECESCHDYSVDQHKIIQCEACGEWFSNDVLHDDDEEIGKYFQDGEIVGVKQANLSDL